MTDLSLFEKSLSFRDRALLREKFPEETSYRAALSRLASHEPLAYLLGEWYFYEEVYRVSPACLIPRPETEHLVEEAIRLLPPGGRFADLCTGSGCIAVSVLAHRPDVSALAVDLSKEALALAAENASRNGVGDRISFLAADLLKENPLGEQTFDLIVSNPPYIRSDILPTLDKEVLAEPSIALDGGPDGLVFYRALLGRFLKNIKPGGALLCEIGYDQGEALRALCPCEIQKDYAGLDRVMLLRV